MNLNEKTFKPVSNSANGEVGLGTVFHYRQEGPHIWGYYEGGSIKKGFLVGVQTDESGFEMKYMHIGISGKVKTGECRSRVIVGLGGKITIKEKWKWTCDDFSEGESEIAEF